MKTILLTGSDGFIGSHIAEDLLKNNYQVLGVDNHSKYKIPCINHHNHINFISYNDDLSQQDQVLNLSKKIEYNNLQPDYIIHAAARIGGIKMFHDEPADIILNNAEIDSNVLRLAKRWEVKRFIGLSSSMVYENTTWFPSTESSTKYIAPPTSSYGFSKLTMERMIEATAKQFNLKYVIIRPFNAIGLGENDFLEGKSSHVLPDLIIKCLQGQTPLNILGTGEQIRHFTHAADIARGIRYALERSEDNEIYNISSPVSTKIIDLARIVWNKINPKKPLHFNVLTPFEYDIQKRVPDITKAKNQLGFETEINLEAAINEVIQYIKQKI